jgi:predicted RNA binding protein YcfA (HicA-like mRNA interferase family)
MVLASYRTCPWQKPHECMPPLLRDGWVLTRQRGSHRMLPKDERTPAFAHHDAHELGGVQLAQLARDAGYTMDEISHSVKRRDP